MLPLIYLNLDRDTQRRQVFEASIASVGLDAIRLPALTPATMPDRIAQRFQPGVGLVPGEIGCFASHIAAWEQVANGASGWYLICEDDAAPRASLSVLVALLQDVKADLPFVQLCGTLKSSSLRLSMRDGMRLVRPLFTLMNSTAYALRPETARALLLAAVDIGVPVDGFLRKYGRVQLNMLAVMPAPFEARDFPSTTSSAGRRGNRSKIGFKGHRFSLIDEAKFVSRFGLVGFVRVYLAYLVMKSLRVKHDTTGRFEVAA